jgi:hypothetical protein
VVNVPPGVRDGSLLRLPGNANRDDLFVRVRIRRVGQPLTRVLAVAVVIALAVLAFTLRPGHKSTHKPPPVAATQIPQPVLVDQPSVGPHTETSKYSPLPIETPRDSGFTAGTCLTGEIPNTTVPVPANDVTEIPCGSKAAHYKVIKTFDGTSDMSRCRSVRRTQYAYSEILTVDNIRTTEFVYCMVGLGRYAR